MKKLIYIFIFTILSGSSVRAETIHYLTIEGIVNPVMSEFIIKGIENASKEKAEAVVIQIDTPGGLDLSMRDITKAVLSSDVPVIVYVAPSGARAASAGVFIAYASHIAAMAPGTNIGAAHPVAMGGEKMDETMSKKVENDAVAYIKGIASKRHRNADWAEKAVRESASITAEEALKTNVIEIIAADKDALIKAVNGKKVELGTGERVLKTEGAKIQDIEMGMRLRILNAITNPNVAYILLMIGLIGIYFELSNPGAILPGVVGGIFLILAFYAMQTLSVNYAGILLIGLGLIFFIAEIKVISYGLLTIAGIIALTLGSLMLFESPLPFMKLSVWVVLPTVLMFSALFLAALYYAVRIRKQTPVSGKEGLINEIGTADTDISNEGKVFIDGEYWDAWSSEPIGKGEKIRVVAMQGLRLMVARLER